MVNLHQYYKEEKWNAFLQHIVPIEFTQDGTMFTVYCRNLPARTAPIICIISSPFF